MERPRPLDPRLFQIAALAGLLAWGMLGLDFDVAPARAGLLVATALAAQYAWTRVARLPVFDPKSALISALSLTLLLRTSSWAVATAAAAIAVSSKFALRIGGKHVFNPTNIAIVALVATGKAWVSPGQWGTPALFAFAVAAAGSLVVSRASRADVTLAFLAFHAAILVGRSMRLGEPLSIPLRRLESGSLLIFAFFMISDPKTTPDSRLGRILFALAVAAGGWYVQFRLFRPNGLLFSLAAACAVVPLIDRVFPGRRFTWRPDTSRKEISMTRLIRVPALCLTVFLLLPAGSHAFCGFYVAKADAKLFNKASRVVLARNGDRTIMTMANDFSGPVSEFALVVPVPTTIIAGQVHIGDAKAIDHLDAYSAPRLVEYFDPDPCRMAEQKVMSMAEAPMAAGAMKDAARNRSLGVTIEATFSLGEYDIVVLSAVQSHGLRTWLVENGYRLPAGAGPVLGSYIRQGMHFFVAKVNLKEQAKSGYRSIRPLQIAYESPKFMLPIRLGTVNADGPQELFVFALTPRGRIETTNYRTVRLPSGMDVPETVRDRFGEFYKAVFARKAAAEDDRAVTLEYAWDLSWCDPCAAEPLSAAEQRDLGIFWSGDPGNAGVFLTRLHVRYDREHFPEDLVFQETADRENFQARYVLRHAWAGTQECAALPEYRKSVAARREVEARTLAELTGWNLAQIRRQMALPGHEVTGARWWEKIWSR